MQVGVNAGRQVGILNVKSYVNYYMLACMYVSNLVIFHVQRAE